MKQVKMGVHGHSIHGPQVEQGTSDPVDHMPDIEIAKGLARGKKHTGGGFDKVMEAKHNPEPRRRAHAFNVRSESGKADKTGGWGR